MNLRYQETFCIILLLFSSIIAEDFDFVREVKDDVKVSTSYNKLYAFR